MRMGSVRSLVTNLSAVLLFLLVGTGAAFRILVDDGKGPPPPLLTPIASPKGSNSESSKTAPQKDNKLTDHGSSTHPSPPSKPGDNPPRSSISGEETKKRDGSSKDDPAKSASPATKRKEEDEKGKPSPPKPINNTLKKEVKDSCKSSCFTCQSEKFCACIQHSKEDPKSLSLVVQNTGENAFTLKIRGQPALHLSGDNINIKLPKSGSKQIDLPRDDWNVTEIMLLDETGNCTFQIAAAPVSDWKPIQAFPGYDIHLNPIYALYLLVLTVVIIGATCACCKFRNRRNRDGSGVPYQQLEMGEHPLSTSVVNSNSADGWDDWDEDWDDKAARPSEKPAAVSLSSNGLTSRTPKKDGWDNSWDD